jgi:hypothetical protein
MVESLRYAFLSVFQPWRRDWFQYAIGVELGEYGFYQLHDTVDTVVGEFVAFDLAGCQYRLPQQT